MNRWFVGLGVVALLTLALVSSGWISSPVHAETLSAPIVISMTHHDTSQPLSQMMAMPVLRGTLGESELRTADAMRRSLAPEVAGKDEALEQFYGREADEGSRVLPSPSAGWKGINSANSSCNCAPPDTNGDVGLNQYVQVVNTAMEVWDKSGNKLAGPTPLNTIFHNFGGKCETTNDGDPVILFDSISDRWFFSQFANVFSASGPYYQCLAVSTGDDPTGSWYRYEFKWPGKRVLNDYGKFGVWPDGYYMTANQFKAPNFTWVGTGVVAFERSKMLLGQSAQAVYFNLGKADWGGMLPSDLDGTPPAPGTPNYFFEIQDHAWDPVNIPQDQMTVHAFHVDWTTPANSTFTSVANLKVANFNGILCGFGACVPQKGTSQKLDTLEDRTMFRAQYRNFGSYATVVTNHSVNVGSNRAGIRWYEIRITGGTPSIYQQSTYSPGKLNRWMGSAAMDQVGDIAIGFSESSSSMFPAIAYAGRLSTDTLGVLAQGEAIMKQGTGSQTGTKRWGDYSGLTVDPSDGCTFWYTNEYYKSTSSFNWQTWIGKFKFNECS